jgi:hypothetical protein
MRDGKGGAGKPVGIVGVSVGMGISVGMGMSFSPSG